MTFRSCLLRFLRFIFPSQLELIVVASVSTGALIGIIVGVVVCLVGVGVGAWKAYA